MHHYLLIQLQLFQTNYCLHFEDGELRPRDVEGQHRAGTPSSPPQSDLSCVPARGPYDLSKYRALWG